MNATDTVRAHGGTRPVIVADPLWRYGQNDQRCRSDALNHYATMADEDIAALPVQMFAADDALLVMWATWPKVAEGTALVTGKPVTKLRPMRRQPNAVKNK